LGAIVLRLKGLGISAALIIALGIAIGSLAAGSDSGGVAIRDEPPIPAQQTTDVEITLFPGFNEFTYVGAAAPVEEALASIDGLYSVLFQWDAEAQLWLIFRPGQIFLSSFLSLEPGGQYWIVVNQRLRLTMTAAPPPCRPATESPFIQSYEAMWAFSDAQGDLLAGLLADLQADPSLALLNTTASLGWFGSMIAIANQVIATGGMLTGLVAEPELASLQLLVSEQAADVLGAGIGLLGGILTSDPDDYLAVLPVFQQVTDRHESILELAAGWCDLPPQLR
jgi:hypothetical protein